MKQTEKRGGPERTFEDRADCEEIGADGENDHGEGEPQELHNDVGGDGGCNVGLFGRSAVGLILVEDGLFCGDDTSGRHFEVRSEEDELRQRRRKPVEAGAVL